MLSWFNRKKREHKIEELSSKVVKPLNYPAKIILAWAKAIEGNDNLIFWLKDNGYPELVMATYAIYLKEDARVWLQENGYTHLMAMINAAEGNESAQKWLLVHNFDLLYHIAMTIEDDRDSLDWLGKNAPADIFLLAQSIKSVKDKIEEHHNDIHTFREDI